MVTSLTPRSVSRSVFLFNHTCIIIIFFFCVCVCSTKTVEILFLSLENDKTHQILIFLINLQLLKYLNQTEII